MTKKQTLVIGASPNPERFSYKAVERLTGYGHHVYAYGIRKGFIGEVQISDVWPTQAFHTVTLYINPSRQVEYYDRIIDLGPERVIFNPGTENSEFAEKLKRAGIEVQIACTLVMLNLNNY